MFKCIEWKAAMEASWRRSTAVALSLLHHGVGPEGRTRALITLSRCVGLEATMMTEFDKLNRDCPRCHQLIIAV